MKKIIAIAAIVATSSASAFWGNNSYNGYNNGYGNGAFDGVGDASGAADFSMNFSGKGNTNMRSNSNFAGNGYNYQAPYWAATPYGYGAPAAPFAAPVAPAAPQAPAAK